MGVGEAMAAAVGEWVGVNRLRLMPTDDYRESASRATVGAAAGGHAVTVSYDWVEEGVKQEGLVVLGDGEGPGEVEAVWVDSWHQQPRWMAMRGRIGEDGVVTVEGSYGEGMGWRIRLEPGGGGPLLAMENVMPGMDYRVVEGEDRRGE